MNQSEQLRIEAIYEKLEKKVNAEALRVGNKIPYIATNGTYEEDKSKTAPSWWTNGFWAGMLWQLYHATEKDVYKDTARFTESVMRKSMDHYEGLHHDVGFQFLHSAIADYRLTGNEESRKVGLHAANLLAGRFNIKGNFIRAWNHDKTGWMIIDCMMNIPILYWASKEINDPRFAYIAKAHADTVLEFMLRPDGSSNHIVIFNPETGEFVDNPAGQGYASGSSWTRGQAWAVYGFALSALHTGNPEYLDAAKRVAHYFISNIALTGWVSKIDFRAPEDPVCWDTSATACAACGLLQIVELVDDWEKDFYRKAALNMIFALDEKHCDWDVDKDGFLQDGAEAYEGDRKLPVAMVYSDYFYTEAILRLLGKSFLIW